MELGPVVAPQPRRRRTLALATLLVVLAAVGVVLWRARGGAAAVDAPRVEETIDPDLRVPEGVRVRVEVLNATTTRGLARRATQYLRRRGFDVVAMGNAETRRDSTHVVVYTGMERWGQLAATLLGGGSVELRPDTSRYLDLTVVVGAGWTPPPDPLDP